MRHLLGRSWSLTLRRARLCAALTLRHHHTEMLGGSRSTESHPLAFVLFFGCPQNDVPDAIIADRGRLTQIVSNLCNNSLKFSDAFATVTLSVSRSKTEPSPAAAAVSRAAGSSTKGASENAAALPATEMTPRGVGAPPPPPAADRSAHESCLGDCCPPHASRRSRASPPCLPASSPGDTAHVAVDVTGRGDSSDASVPEWSRRAGLLGGQAQPPRAPPPPDGWLVFKVEDTGVGLSAETIEFIFEVGRSSQS